MNAFLGTRQLIRLILRRDRFLLPVWVFLMGTIPINLTGAIRDLYPTAAQRQQYFEVTASDPSYMALFGPVFGSNFGALGAQRASNALVVVALISVLTVIRHTRTEEESGRRELLSATVLGRHAPATAALVVTVAANLLTGAILAFGLLALDLPAAGAFAFGLALALAGSVFAAVGALTAQVSQSATAARGIGLSALALAFLLRVAGDTGGPDSGSSWLSWLSPIGWLQHARPFAGERWWVFLPALALTAALVAGAYALSARRDVGAGVLPQRLGPAQASPALRSPLALAWRLHRGLLIAWSAGFAVAGAAFGGIAESAGNAMDDSERLQDLLARLGGSAGLSDVYLAATASILGLVAAAYAIQAVLRLRAEEAGQRAEPILATSVARLRWGASHLVFALLGPTVALACYGLAAGLAYGASTSDVGGQVPRVLGGALAQLPAVWTLAALAVALFGMLPRLAAAAWAALAACLLFGQFGEILELDQRLLDVSPFTHIPRLPGGEVTATPLVWLSVIAAALTAAGLAGLRRRDMPLG